MEEVGERDEAAAIVLRVSEERLSRDPTLSSRNAQFPECVLSAFIAGTKRAERIHGNQQTALFAK